MNSPHVNLKLLLLASLWFFGFALIAFSFVKKASLGCGAWGGLCILAALVWMYWDNKRRLITPDEELEELLMEVARRYRHTRSLNVIVDEYRERGAAEDTLNFVRSAPRMLKTRADAKILLGLQLLTGGLVATIVTCWLSRAIGFNHYEVAVGALGGGFGFLITGLRQQRAFPENEIIP
jgi:hypothetical protein